MLRIGIIGTGNMAQTMARAIAGVPGMETAGFASRDPARAEGIAAQMKAGRGYAGLDAMLADPAVDALYIANATAAHAEAAKAALAAGKPVLCEKPCATNAAEMRALAASAQRSGTLLMEAIATPFLPAVRSALAAAASGRLGVIGQFSASFGYPANARSHPDCFAPGGGVLLDRGVYGVTLARLACGPIADMRAEVRRRDEVDVEATLLLRHDSGAVSTVAVSFDAELDNRMTIAGSTATAFVDAPLLAAESVRIVEAGTPERAGPPSRLKAVSQVRRAAGIARALRAPRLSYGASPYAHELIHFRDLVAAGARESPVLPPSLSVEVMEVLDAARRVAA